jgi:hypothetical protein
MKKKWETIYSGASNIETLLKKLDKAELIAWAENEIKEWKKFIKFIKKK